MIQNVSASSGAAVTVDIKNKIPNYNDLTSDDFMLKTIGVYGSSYTSKERTITVTASPNLTYNPNTGVVTITGLYGYYSSEVNNSISVKITAGLYVFPNGLSIS